MKAGSIYKTIILLTAVLVLWVQCSHTLEPQQACEGELGNEAGNIFGPYDEPPRPVGGFAEIQKHVIYTEEALRLGIEGRVTVHILVCHTGELVDFKVLQSLGYGLDEAAVNAIKSVEWMPAKQRDKPVSVWVAIPVIFRLK